MSAVSRVADRVILASIASLPLFSGCADWPRSSHLEDSDLDYFEPKTTVLAESSEADADFPADTSGDVPVLSPFELGDFYTVQGDLATVGWDSSLNGGDIFGTFDVPAGFYSGDVDILGAFNVPEGGARMCAKGAFTAEDGQPIGWDLMLLNANGLVGVDTADGTVPLGFGLGGANAGWSSALEAGDYLMVTAGYFGTSAAAYSITVSLHNPDYPDTYCPPSPSGSEQ